MADIYHLTLEADNFIDIEVLAAGALLPDLQDEFGRYWNARTACPLATSVAPPSPH